MLYFCFGWKSWRKVVTKIPPYYKVSRVSGLYTKDNEFWIIHLLLWFQTYTILHRKLIRIPRYWIWITHLKYGISNSLPPESLPDVSSLGRLKDAAAFPSLERCSLLSHCLSPDTCCPDGLLGAGFPTEHNAEASTVANVVCSQAHFLCGRNEYG